MRIGVAASGGRDSTALLHCTLRMARPLGIEVIALHVHHGLVAQADEWVRHLRRQTSLWACESGGLSLAVTRLEARPARGDSVEAWARKERYAALRDMARERGCGAVLLAHHRRDQAETVLLQALRGAGAAGLAASPKCAERDGLVWYRPWLELPRTAIDAYLQRWGLTHVHDSSNDDLRFARNRLRARLWPAITEAFADAEQGLTGVARQAQEAKLCLAALAALDGAEATERDELIVAPWLSLEPARRANLLRHWLRSLSQRALPDSLVQRLLDELPRARQGRWPWHDQWLLLRRGRLALGGARPSGQGRAP